MRWQKVLCFFATLLTLNFIGCGSGSISSNNPPTPTPSLNAIAVTPSSTTISAGATQQFKATGSYSDGSSKDLTSSVAWGTSSSSIASISSSGLLTPLAAGQITVTASLESIEGKTGATITDKLVSIQVSGNETNLNVGTSVQLTALGTYQDNKPAKALSGVTWTSSAPSIATVSNGGLVTAVAPGSAKISATLSGIDGALALDVNALILEKISVSAGSSNVNVASQEQLTATGTYNDGSVKNITNGVVWQSSNTSKATVSAQGVVSGVYHGPVSISASLNSVSGSAQLNIVAVLNSIVLNPIGPGVLVGGNQQFTATGFYNDGSSNDVTSSATWSSSGTGVATVAPGGKATAVGVGAANITASQGSVNAVTALNVVSSSYVALSGDYAFTLTSLDSRGPSNWAGSLNFGGSGSLSGLEDCNTGSGIQQQVAVSGSYIEYPDGRGNIIFNSNLCHASGITFRFNLASTGTTGSLIEFDGVNTAHGTLTQQNTSAFGTSAINGTYVFRAAGVDARFPTANGPVGITTIGLFATDGNGNITSGVDDINDFGNVEGQNPLSASIYSVASNGRGTMQLTDGNGTTNYAVYMVDTSKFYFLQTDAMPNTAVAGIAELQMPGSYGNVTGTFSYLIDSPIIVEPNVPQIVVKEGQLGMFTMTSPSTYSGVLNYDTVNGTYMNNYGSINGRGQVSTCGSGQTCTNQFDQKIYFYYMISPSKMLVMQAFSYSNYPQYSPAVGEADLQQQTPYSVSTLDGTYVLQAHQGNSFADALMLLSFDGAGDVAGIVDQDQIGGVSTTVLGAPQYISTPAGNGNTVLQLTTPGGTQNYYLYLYSNSSAFLGGVTAPLDGTLTQQ